MVEKDIEIKKPEDKKEEKIPENEENKPKEENIPKDEPKKEVKEEDSGKDKENKKKRKKGKKSHKTLVLSEKEDEKEEPKKEEIESIKEEKPDEIEEKNIIIEKETKEDDDKKDNLPKNEDGEKPKTDKFRIMKKIIKGNKIIKQMIDRLKEGDKEQDIIISSIEEYTKLEDKDKDKNKGKGKRKRKGDLNKREEDEEEIIEEEQILEEGKSKNGNIKLKIKKRIIKEGKVTDQIIEREGEGDDMREIIISLQEKDEKEEDKEKEKDEDSKLEQDQEELIEEIIIQGNGKDKGRNKNIKLQKLIKRGNTLIQQVVERNNDAKGKDREKIIEEESINLENEANEQLKDAKKRIIVKRIITYGNKVIEQILKREGEGENEKDIIISQKEEVTKGKRRSKKGDEELIIIEEYIIIIIENGKLSKSKNHSSIKIIYTKWIIKGNNVTEYLIEKEGEGENAKEKILSQKEYILPAKLAQLLRSLGITIVEDVKIEEPKQEENNEYEEEEQKRKVFRGRNKKPIEKNKEEDKKGEISGKVITHGGSKEGKKGNKKEDEKEESGTGSRNRQGGAGSRSGERKNVGGNDENNKINVEYVEYKNDTVELPHKWRTHPRLYGKDSRYCRVCRNTHGLIRKYGLNMCRKCFRERFQLIGFKQTK